eukprot:TRINITY_DN40460_c0_g1_i1.p1 TRINITY_DN40460_c0_g1~~TRINITY_DN40460_c0_g1_i1.p1  ORF type:complete len:186 (+),score=20.21 TRINITY_DN40460_c0_g1_i1:3-560(+)
MSFTLGPLEPLAQSKLFLRRASRPLCKSDFGQTEDMKVLAPQLPDSDLLTLAETPRLQVLNGNPRHIIAEAQSLSFKQAGRAVGQDADLSDASSSVVSTPRDSAGSLRRVRLVRPDGKTRDEWLRRETLISDLVVKHSPKALEGMAEVVIMGCRAQPESTLNDFPDNEDLGLLVLELRAREEDDW